MNFKQFFHETSEYDQDLKDTLSKLPAAHRKFVKGYDFDFQSTNTLKNDKGHIGIIDPKKNKITVSAPWNYGREFALLHEIAHLIWELLDKDTQKEWSAIVKRTKEKQNQSAEELFCMAYANTYANNKITIHDHPEWERFIKTKLPK